MSTRLVLRPAEGRTRVLGMTTQKTMSLTTAIAIYFIIWWVVLFAVLPWGVRSQEEHGSFVGGTDPGAPAIPRLGAKLLWTTMVATVVFGLFYFIYVNRLVSLDDLATLFGLLR
ncbi:MAG TPA: DUF1467 family protein [Xanthobacteraceae bacterium]|nr:DUF1467 family protein [Xanthobacteraceae bacterium]